MAKKHKLEKQLIKLCEFDEEYDDRQDELTAMAKALGSLKDDAFSESTDNLALWYNLAAEAINKKKELPEFAKLKAAAKKAGREDEYSAEEEAADSEFDDDDDEETEDAPEDEAGDDDAESETTAEDEADDSGDEGTTDEPDDDDDTDDEDSEADAAEDAAAESANEAEEAATEMAKPKSKSKAKPEPKAAKAPAKEAAKPAKKKPVPTRYDHLTGEKDKWGIMRGTKTSEALEMYEKGATAREIFERLQGRHYNILGIMVKQGHVLEKLEGGRFKLTHKDEIGKAPAKKGKK